jgi:MFS family permease
MQLNNKSGSLWHNADFMKFWTGQTVSLFGSQITELALPLTAVLVLKATTFQLGLLSALGFAPFLILSLFAGVWVDRRQRRPILIRTNLASGVLVGSIPVAAAFNILSIEYLYVVAFFTGVSSVFFQVAYLSYVPSLLERDQLIEGNSKLGVSNSLADLAGPGVAGILIQVLTGPFAIIFDAISFLFAAGSLSMIRKPEPAFAPTGTTRRLWKEIGQGLRLLLSNPILRSITACTCTNNFFSSVTRTLFVLYVVKTLNIEPSLLGIILTVGSIGPFLSVLFITRITSYFGLGPTIVWFRVGGDLASLLIPLAGGPPILTILILVLSQFGAGFAAPLYSVNAISIRQAIASVEWQGRINATSRFITWGAIPLGALVGGELGQLLGLRLTLWLAALGLVFSFLWVYFSPVIKLKTQDDLQAAIIT